MSKWPVFLSLLALFLSSSASAAGDLIIYSPLNYTGLVLIFLGVSLMILEVFISSFGVIGLGGVIAFITGCILLSDHLSWTAIATMSIASIAFILILINLAIKSHKRKIVTGQEGLIGSQGIVLSVVNEKITVRVAGEIWEAKSISMLNPGDAIKVTHIQGLTLLVQPFKKE